MQKVELKALIESSIQLNLLVVEDDDTKRDATVEFLSTFFQNIISAVDGKEALEKFHKNDIDLIITDINMPKMNGLELISQIREINSDLPILILSAHTESKYFTESIKYSVDGYLLKPFDVQQFFFILSKIIKRHEKQGTITKTLTDEKSTLKRKGIIEYLIPIRVSMSVLLLLFAYLYIKNTSLLLMFYTISYLIRGYDVLIAAGKNILSGKVFDEKFLMSIATIGAMAIGYIVQRKVVKGSCGGLGALGIAKACDCPEPCDRKLARMEKEAIRAEKIKAWEKDKIM